ncbi:MAG: 6-phosphogluconolactonase [Chlamydiae bacterium]|nr:6-phosphogluconolactonase [Chlamydiota bacterium]
MQIEQIKVKSWDERRNLLIPGDQNTTLNLCLRHFIAIYQQSIQNHGSFYVALAGGSTPRSIYEHLCSLPYKDQIDWSKIWLFWSDERNVPPNHPESNYQMAMNGGFKNMAIPPNQIHRMVAEKELEKNALEYEKTILSLFHGSFDLVLLGIGEDGHTASLFPNTKALDAKGRLVIENYLPQKKSWRMTLTIECINQAKNIAIYVFGPSKKHIVKEVFTSPNQELYPAQKIGTKEHKALWIIDEAAASEILHL